MMDTSFLVIVAAAIVTYGLRLGGLLLAGRLPSRGRFKVFMDALPGTILLSLIVPAALTSGFWGWVATLCTGLCRLRTGNVFLSMILGVAIIGITRSLEIGNPLTFLF